ncbi:histone acetyltransferase Spt10 [Amniculicola lignicola CBS 123094]|uniref:Histone acetyltransferase Spt10 n=1 Tax=Amniculicola lignicola CBS 123094 TaxID=1392246 RepID=A0A6A5WJR2_9PLEO|nr:histone acetyltransferase Spt10 [Amniculicola lignicola CBS 123094]
MSPNAMLDDPTGPVYIRTSGGMPYPPASAPLPLGIAPRQVILRDRVTIATIVPFSSPAQVPLTLLAYLSDQLNREIEKGDTYPMIDALPLEDFGPYWFGVFGAVMILGDVRDVGQVHHMSSTGHDWEKECLGSFYIKPNYPGRSSHVCNGGFLVTDGARNRGVGRLMGETYLDYAPRLGYTYSVFNLVYETNVVSCRIWDALGFKRIGRVKGCGNLKSYPNELVDAIIYGRELGQDEDFVSEERFDKIRFYLKNGKYPNGADRAEKSRLRSAATHYKLLPGDPGKQDRLMLKGKEVISDAQQQYEIAREIHHKSHGGINKTTAAIAELYHWVRIKETVSQVIRNCPECSEMNKGQAAARALRNHLPTTPGGSTNPHFQPENERSLSPSDQIQMEAAQQQQQSAEQVENSNHQSYSIPHQYNHFDMPLDPALMDGSNHASLADLPPSPFLAAGQGLPMPQLPNLDMSGQNLPAPVAMMTSEMEGVEHERAPTAREELRRRLTRAAGYAKRMG